MSAEGAPLIAGFELAPKRSFVEGNAVLSQQPMIFVELSPSLRETEMNRAFSALISGNHTPGTLPQAGNELPCGYYFRSHSHLRR